MKTFKVVINNIKGEKELESNDFIDIDIYVNDLEKTPLSYLRVSIENNEFVLKNTDNGEILDSKPIEKEDLIK